MILTTSVNVIYPTVISDDVSVKLPKSVSIFLFSGLRIIGRGPVKQFSSSLSLSTHGICQRVVRTTTNLTQCLSESKSMESMCSRKQMGLDVLSNMETCIHPLVRSAYRTPDVGQPSCPATRLVAWAKSAAVMEYL